MATVDWTNPCARASALREAYFALLSGKGAQEIEFQSGESRRRVRYQGSTAAQMDALKRELDAAEAACAAALAGRAPARRRFAIGSTTKGFCR